MALIKKSISVFGAPIGVKPGNTLNQFDVVKYAAAYGTWLMPR